MALLHGDGFNAATIVVSGLSLCVAIVGTVFMFKAVPPRKRLQILFFAEQPIADFSNPYSSLRVSNHDKCLPEPQIIRVHIRNTGTADIRSDDFDAGEPLCLQLEGTEMVAVTPRGMTPRTTKCSVAEDRLTVGPVHIPRKQTIELDVLTARARVAVSEPIQERTPADTNATSSLYSADLFADAARESNRRSFVVGLVLAAFGVAVFLLAVGREDGKPRSASSGSQVSVSQEVVQIGGTVKVSVAGYYPLSRFVMTALERATLKSVAVVAGSTDASGGGVVEFVISRDLSPGTLIVEVAAVDKPPQSKTTIAGTTTMQIVR